MMKDSSNSNENIKHAAVLSVTFDMYLNVATCFTIFSMSVSRYG